MRRLRSALFHLIYAYAPGFARCGALLRKSLYYPPKKSSKDDFLSFSKFGCTWHSPNKFVLCTRLHEFSAPEGAWAFPLCSNAHAHFIV